MSELVRMTRPEPTRPGGPTQANVHPDNVDEMKSQGWLVRDEAAEPEPKKASAKTTKPTTRKPTTRKTTKAKAGTEKPATK